MFLKDFFEKVNFEKIVSRQQQKDENYLACKEFRKAKQTLEVIYMFYSKFSFCMICVNAIYIHFYSYNFIEFLINGEKLNQKKNELA